MAHGKFKVLDSDIHIIEPPDLWTRYIDPAFRDRAPIGLTEDEGDLRLAHAGKPWGRVSGVDADRNRRRQGRNYALNQERWRPYEVNGRNWHDPYYEPLWAALEELEVPLGFHEGSGSQLRQVGEQFGANTMLKHIYSHPVEMMLTTGAFCAGGILERHPRLRVAFLEGNCSWVPFLLWRMDEHWEWIGDVYARDLTMAPSEYFKRQCFVSVECDEEPVKHVIDAIGDDRIVFSTDFPHGDSKFPRAVESFLQLPISDESKRKILWDNCAAYYGLPA